MSVSSQHAAPRDPSRRGFLEALLASSAVAALGSVLYPVLRYVIPPEVAEAPTTSVVAGQVGDLAPNSGRIFKFGSRPGIIIRTAAGEYRAFSATCTHLQCVVQYRDDQQLIWCACHNGRYDLNGTNVAGPPPRPLEAYDVAIRDSDIVVTKRT